LQKIRNHTTISLKKATKDRLVKARAPGQCYDGFLCQLMDLWEESARPEITYKKRRNQPLR
jgi:hypothetical protein